MCRRRRSSSRVAWARRYHASVMVTAATLVRRPVAVTPAMPLAMLPMAAVMTAVAVVPFGLFGRCGGGLLGGRGDRGRGDRDATASASR